MDSVNFIWNKTKQLSLVQLLLAFIIPSTIAFVGFRVVLPIFVNNGVAALIAWPIVASVMLLGLVIFSLHLIKQEANELNVSIWSRMCLKTLSVKQWVFYLIVLILGIAISGVAVKFVVPFMNVSGIKIPDYFPFFLNPTIDPMTADSSVLSPGFPLKGQWLLILLMAVALILNIAAEELYFRAWMLPKLSKYGNKSWIINGILFALYHSFQFWLFPTILIGSLVWAFVIYKSKSIWPALIGHFVANFLFSILGMIMLIAK